MSAIISNFKMFGKACASILHNPHHYSAAILARLATIMASVLWAVVVLWEPQALSQLGYGSLLYFMREDYWGLLLLGVSVILFARMVLRSPPHLIALLAYAFLALFWSYLWFLLVLDVLTNKIPLRPGQFAWATVGMICAMFSFISNPKLRNDIPYID